DGIRDFHVTGVQTCALPIFELDLINAIGGAETAAAVEELRVAALGKSGSISGLLKGMGAMSPEERREKGPMINGLRDRVSAALEIGRASCRGRGRRLGVAAP